MDTLFEWFRDNAAGIVVFGLPAWIALWYQMRKHPRTDVTLAEWTASRLGSPSRVVVTGLVQVSSPHPTFAIEAMTVTSPAIGGAELRLLDRHYLNYVFKAGSSPPLRFEMDGIPGVRTLICDVRVRLKGGARLEQTLEIPLG